MSFFFYISGSENSNKDGKLLLWNIPTSVPALSQIISLGLIRRRKKTCTNCSFDILKSWQVSMSGSIDLHISQSQDLAHRLQTSPLKHRVVPRLRFSCMLRKWHLRTCWQRPAAAWERAPTNVWIMERLRPRPPSCYYRFAPVTSTVLTPATTNISQTSPCSTPGVNQHYYCLIPSVYINTEYRVTQSANLHPPPPVCQASPQLVGDSELDLWTVFVESVPFGAFLM